MFRHTLRTVALTATLLGSIATLQSTAFASARTEVVPASQSRLAALTQSYFVALNHALVTGSFSSLRDVFAARATLTERSSLTLIEPSPQVSTVRGRSAIIRFYRHLSADVPGTRWIVGVMNQVSPTTMVVYARIGGTQGTPLLFATQRLTMKNGKIRSVQLTLYRTK